MNFVADDSVIERDLAEGGPPYEIDEGAWFETWFELPVRIAMDDVELLEGPRMLPDDAVAGPGWTTVPQVGDPRYTRLPLVGFAVDLSHLMTALQDGSESRWRPGSLRFKREPAGMVRVCSARLGREVLVSERELGEVAETFIARVKEFLLHRAPGIDRHPQWKEWFPAVGSEPASRG